MNQISIRGLLLVVPKMCCCCCDPKPKKRYRVAGSRTGRWVNQSYTDKRWLFFPLCKRCDRWIRAEQAARTWLPTFAGALVLGVAAAGGAVPTFGTTLGYVVAGFAGVLLLVAALAFALWRVNQGRARRFDPGPPYSWQPVVLADWLRDKHTFRFANEEYFRQFHLANRDYVA